MPEAQWRHIPIVCPGHSRPLAEVQFSEVTPDGSFLISACLDKMPMLRNGETGDWIGTFIGHKGAVWSAQLDKTATRAVTGAADFTAKLWNAITGEELHTFSHKHIVRSTIFSEDGKTICTGGHDKNVHLYDLGDYSAAPNDLQCESVVRKVIYADDNTILSGDGQGRVKVWDLRQKAATHSIDLDSLIMDMELSVDGSVLSTAYGDKVHFFDARQGFKSLHKHQMPVNFLEEGGVSLHPNKKTFIAGGSDLWVRVFDFETGDELECRKGHHGPIRCLRFSRDGESFATGSEDGTIRLWQTDSKPAAEEQAPEQAS